jgi:glycosyltransferase involved in cell wall biosynthesis
VTDPTPAVTLIGHPFSPIGMGEHIRSSFRALGEVGHRPGLMDIYGLDAPDPSYERELGPCLRGQSEAPVHIFHINADEVSQALAHLDGRLGTPRYSIIYPAWELSRFPAAWVSHLEQFDEVWAPSRFIQASISTSTPVPVYHMPLAVELTFPTFLDRRHFGIPESAYAFLFHFDFRSYVTRKNPEGSLRAFEMLVRSRPRHDVVLVMKIQNGHRAPEAYGEFLDLMRAGSGPVVLIDRTLTDIEMKNLVRCCDCFLSLHRSEGFGRGPAEAMFLSKPVIATAYSGNLDFMTSDNSLLVDYRLRPVPPGAYPFAEGQQWAEPDLEAAVAHMIALVDDPAAGRALGARARRSIRRDFSSLAAGLRYVDRLRDIGKAAADGLISPRGPC